MIPLDNISLVCFDVLSIVEVLLENRLELVVSLDGVSVQAI